mgnify:CR=1 FL=1|jgi:hypothetical protein
MRDKKAEKEMQRFDKWMRTKIKSIHYADNKRMSEAFERVYNNINSTTIKESL